MSTEKSLQQWFTKECRSRGFLNYKFVSPSQSGVPDVIVIGNGVTTYVELKTPRGTGKLSPLQSYVHGKMRGAGAKVLVTNDKDELKRWLDVEHRQLG